MRLALTELVGVCNKLFTQCTPDKRAMLKLFTFNFILTVSTGLYDKKLQENIKMAAFKLDWIKCGFLKPVKFFTLFS